VFGQVRFLFPSHTKPARSNIPLSTPVLGAWYQFFERTVVYHTHNRVKIPIGYRRDGLAELTSKLAPFTYRVDTEKVVDLPPFTKHRKDVVLSPETREYYDTLDKHGVCHIAYDTVIAQFPPTELLRLHQITCGYYVNTEGKVVRLGGTPDKVTATLEILDSIGEEPVVIFTRFREDVAILQDYLVKNGNTSSVLVGGNNQLEEWKEGKTQILIANMAAGAAGVDLTRARLAIFYSVGFSATEMHQALYRVRRANSDKTKPVVYWLLIAQRTVDVHIWNTISDKSDNETLINESLTNPLANDIL
jgi:SNF2 family DNA or RNA helicase